ncbi:MAG: hypothetical protein JXD22_09540 [Sedimentisphaerales bacterium]|nr:hypothetical protein [Sedimentisphaerales bacterium]
MIRAKLSVLIVGLVFCLFCLGAVQGAADETEFDKTRYIGVDELERGMQGYGLTVFQGSKIEKFDVEVVSVMRNYQPKGNAILIRCHDKRFDIAKMVQGVSGSPVYFKGRLAGAMAFGWIMSEEPLYGVTPIREMLQVRRSGKLEKPVEGAAVSGQSRADRAFYQNMMREKLLSDEEVRLLAEQSGLARKSGSDSNTMGMGMLPIGVSVSGLSGSAIAALRSHVPGLAFEVTGGGSGSIGLSGAGQDGPQAGAGQQDKVDEENDPVFAPGGMLTIPLMLGDINGQVSGTITEVVGDEIFGFGHAWRGEGPARWPLGRGFVHTFVSRKDASFKLSNTMDVVGVIRTDESKGVYGRIGEKVEMADVDVEVEWLDTGTREVFHTKIAREQTIGALLASTAVLGAMLQRGELAREHTIYYGMDMDFDGMESISFENVTSGAFTAEIFDELAGTMKAVLQNPWEEVQLRRLKVHAKLATHDSMEVIKSVQTGRRVFEPGQEMQARVVLEPLRGEDRVVNVSLKLPADIVEGKYRVTVGSSHTYRQLLSAAQPQRFTVFKVSDVQRALQERLSVRRDRLYMSTTLKGSGLAIENDWLDDLPGSRRMLLEDESRTVMSSEFRPFLSSATKVEAVTVGQAVFEIEVRR